MTAVVTTAAADTARAAAASAAKAAGIEITRAASREEQAAVVSVLADVWRTDPATIVPLPLLRALNHAGNYTVAVRREGELIGGGFAYLGQDDDGHLHLHSHIIGFVGDERGHGCGYATKLDQRAWALEYGIDTVTWTYDPLVRANAGFNLNKLGAVVETYLPNFYGHMPDGVNAGDESDRMLVTWRLEDPRVQAAIDGVTSPPSSEVLVDEGARVLLTTTSDGRPQATGTDPTSASGPTALVATPEDIVSLRDQDPAAARSWRHAVRDTLGAAMASGWAATGLTADGRYVLSRPGDAT